MSAEEVSSSADGTSEETKPEQPLPIVVDKDSEFFKSIREKFPVTKPGGWGEGARPIVNGRGFGA